MGVDYSRKFDELEKSGNFRNGLGEYRFTRNKLKRKPKLLKNIDDTSFVSGRLRLDSKNRAVVKAYADELMERAQNVDDVRIVSKIYSHIGKSDASFRKKVMNFAERWALTKDYSPRGLNDLRYLVRKSVAREESPKKGLEDLEQRVNRARATFGIIAILASLFFLSPTVTGNVIGNISNSASFSVSGILFGLGLAGLIISFRKN